MKLIQHQELGSAQSSITFSSIPQTFTDLYLLVSDRNASSNDVAMYVTFNGSTSGYTVRRLIGTGSSALSQTFSERLIAASGNANYTASTFSNNAIYIPNYTSSSNKTWSSDAVTENNATGSYQQIVAGLWSNTAAITALEICPNGGTFAQYTSATLYGITKGSDGITTVS